MARPTHSAWLQPDEKPLLVRDRRHLSVVDGFIGIVVGWLIVAGAGLLVTPLFGEAAYLSIGIPIAIGATLLAMFAGFLRHRRVHTTRYVLTKDRAYAAWGQFLFHLEQTTYDKITDLHVHQSFFGRIFGFGSVTLETAGAGISLDGVDDPLAVKRVIEDARTAYIDRLIGEYVAHGDPEGSATPVSSAAESHTVASTAALGTTAPASAGTPTSAAAKRRAAVPSSVWTGRPAPASMAGNMAPALVFFVIGLSSVGFGYGDQDLLALLVPAAFVFFALLTLGGTIVSYKFTRYEIRNVGAVVTSGWLSRKRVETTFDKVTDVTTQQGILGRIFGFGTITINTAGSNQAPVNFIGVRDPDHVKAIIDEARRNHDGGRRR